MNYTQSVRSTPWLLIATALFATAPLAIAQTPSQLPATKHQMESVKGLEGSQAPAAKPATPSTPHQSGVLADAHPTSPADYRLALSGAEEVPAVVTSATGKASVAVSEDKAITGGVSTSGIEATAAHIHVGEVGKNGPVLITLVKDGAQGWLVPADSTLSDADYAHYKAGALYINVHSAAHKDGEIRAQLKP